MKKNKLFILILTFLVTLNFAIAADWVQIAEKTYLDASSLSQFKYFDNDVYYSIWAKNLNNGTDLWKQLEKINGKKIWYNKTLWVVNCSKKEIGTKSSVMYDINENVIYNYEPLYPDWSSIVPETMGEVIYTLVCSTNTANIQTPNNVMPHPKIIQTEPGIKIKIRSHK